MHARTVTVVLTIRMIAPRRRTNAPDLTGKALHELATRECRTAQRLLVIGSECFRGSMRPNRRKIMGRPSLGSRKNWENSQRRCGYSQQYRAIFLARLPTYLHGLCTYKTWL